MFCPLLFCNPLLVCLFLSSSSLGYNIGRSLTVPLGASSTLVARASHPIISAISCTRAFVSFEEVDTERSWESFAWRQGCLEMWTLDGREDMIAVVQFVQMQEFPEMLSVRKMDIK